MPICIDSATPIWAWLESLLYTRSNASHAPPLHYYRLREREAKIEHSSTGKLEREIEFGFKYLQRRNGQNVCTNAALASLYMPADLEASQEESHDHRYQCMRGAPENVLGGYILC
ncbi:hypothetical protein E4T43_02704 [Aureobasidium subglaciale]|nr:hypothetical protein E4T43_02704 [Aureobasidium subglaciale]